MTRQPDQFFSPAVAEMHTTEVVASPELTEVEMESITTRANIRRRQFELKKNLANLDIGANQDVRYNEVRQAVYQSMSGEASGRKIDESLLLQITILRQKAKTCEELNPRQAAYFYAEAAKLEQECGQDSKENISSASRCLEASADLVIANPSHLLPQAILLCVEKKLVDGLPLPENKKTALACKNNPQLLRQYSLILPEEERADFLSNFSDEERRSTGIVLDHTVSEFLPLQFAQTDAEQEQRTAILTRSSQNLGQILSESAEGQGEDTTTLSQTLNRLNGEDSTRQLVEVGSRGLAKAPDVEKQIRRYEYSAKILTELFNIDAIKGGNLAMKFLGKKDLPADLFRHFFEKSVKEKIITDKTSEYFADEENWPFLKKMFAQYPNQFNTVIDTLTQISGYRPAEHETEIFQALQDLDSITPIIFERYRRADVKGKKELAKKIKELKPKFFRNQPIGNVLSREDREILAEMVYLAYQPVGMSFQNVQKFLESVEDHTEDLAKFVFPEDGYPFVMDQSKRYALKSGEKLSQEKLKGFRELFASKALQAEEEVSKTAKILEKLAKAGSDFTNEDLSRLLSLMSGDQQIRSFLERSSKITPDNAYNYLNELKELLGVYFSDNYPERLNNFLSANPKIEGQIIKILSSEDSQATLKKKLAKDGDEVNWQSVATRAEASKTLAIFIQTKVLKLIREEIARMANKFEESEGEGATESKDGRLLKAYISKNVGSFFAKASAGICTAQDVSLFERKDHFHINIVENEQTVRGNIQAYVINDANGGRSLVLRGFNPNSAFLEKIDHGAFCEAVLKIARQFQKDNNFNHVYITESLGGWHALSNREAVTQYLQKRYVKEKKERQFNLQIASSQSVSRIYEI